MNSNGQTHFEWKTTASFSGSHNSGNYKKTSVTVRKHMFIPFVVNGSSSNTNVKKAIENGNNTGRFVSEEFIAEHDGIGLKLKNVSTCSSNANHRLCTLDNFGWLQISDQEFIIKERPKKELTIEKTKHIAKECHQACQQMIDAKERSCIAYSFNSESRKCALFEQITLEVSWLDRLLSNATKKVKNFRKKRHTVSRIALPQTYIAQYQWLISPSVPRELVGKKKSDDYQIIEFANAGVFECIAVCEHSPQRCVKFVFDEVNGKCFLKKEKAHKSTDDDKDSSEEEDDDEEEKYKKIVYKTGWISGRNLKELINQGHVLKQSNQSNLSTLDFDSQRENRTKEYVEIFKPIETENQKASIDHTKTTTVSPTPTSKQSNEMLETTDNEIHSNDPETLVFTDEPHNSDYFTTSAYEDENQILNSETTRFDDQVIDITTNAHQNADISPNSKSRTKVSDHATTKTEFEQSTTTFSTFQPDHYEDSNDSNLTKLIQRIIESPKTALVEPVTISPPLTTDDLAVIREHRFTVGKNTTEEPLDTADTEYMSQFQRCDTNSSSSDDESSALCTLNNFEWLQLADTEIGKPTEDDQKSRFSLPTVEFTFRQADNDGVEQCQRRCQLMAPKEPALPTLTIANGCVAFTYDLDAGKCTLFMEIELEQTWLKRLAGTSSATTNWPQELPKPLGSKRNSVSRVNVPPVMIVGDQWITSYRVLPMRTLTLRYKITEITSTNKTFFGCLNACSQLPGCHEVIYSSVEEICYVLKDHHHNGGAIQKENHSGGDSEKISLKSSWISAKYLFNKKAIELYKDSSKSKGKLEYENSESVRQFQPSATFLNHISHLYPYLVFRDLLISHAPAAAATNNLETANSRPSEGTTSDYLYTIPSCTSTGQTLCNLNNFELIQVKDVQINKEGNTPAKEVTLSRGTDLPESCHNLCVQLKRKHTAAVDLDESKEANSFKKKAYHTCVAYSYEKDTGRCLLYEAVSLEGDWIKSLLTSATTSSSSEQPPKGLVRKRDTTTRIFVPQFEFTLNNHNGIWLIGPQLPPQYMTNMGLRSGQIPTVQLTTADQVYEPFTASLGECAASCQRSKHDCRQFVYNTDRQMCYYVGREEGDFSKEVLLQVGWIGGLYQEAEVTGEQQLQVHSSSANCSEDGYYPHENDCTKFYRCSNGVRFDFDCSPGTHFNPSINNCDWPESAGCSKSAGKVNHLDTEDEVLIQRRCKTCTKHDHSDSHSHGVPPFEPANEESRNSPVTLTEEEVLRILQNHGVSSTKRQIASTKVDNKTKTIHLPYAVNQNETLPTAEEGTEEDFVDSIHVPHKRTISSLPTCSSLPTSATGTEQLRPCKTGSNFDWMQLSDTTLADSDNQTAQTTAQLHKEVKLQSSDGDEVADACGRLCQRMTPLGGHQQQQQQHQHSPSAFTSCVAYSFEVSSGRCLLYSQLKLPLNWVQLMVETTTTTTTTTTVIKSTFKHSPGFKTRLNVPKSQLIMRQWLITPAIPLGISFEETAASTDNSASAYKLSNAKTAHFFDCLTVCMKMPQCLAIVYSALDHKCFVSEKSANASLQEKTVVYRSGWVSAKNLHALTSNNLKNVLQPRSGANRFYIETNAVILDLVEQYLLKKDYKSIIPQSDRKYLNPLDTMTSVTSLDECQNRCAQSWLDKNLKEDHSVKLSEDDEQTIWENEAQIEPRKRRFIDIKKTIAQYKEKKQAKEAEKKQIEIEERLKKFKCKFIAVRENLLASGENKVRV